MALDLVLKLIDKLTDLLKRQQENDRALFTDFVQPVFEDFDKLHQSYLDSFTKYREILGAANGRDDEFGAQLILAIQRDTTQINRQISKLAELAAALEAETTKPFCDSLINYLRHKKRYECELPPGLQRVAQGTIVNGSPRGFRNDNCNAILASTERAVWSPSTSHGPISAEVDYILQTLEENYERTVKEFVSLKRHLLRPR